MEDKLPPLPDEAFDGYREEAAIHRDKPLSNKCDHSQVTFISGSEIRCSCGAGFTGPNIMELYKLLRSK